MRPNKSYVCLVLSSCSYSDHWDLFLALLFFQELLFLHQMGADCLLCQTQFSQLGTDRDGKCLGKWERGQSQFGSQKGLHLISLWCYFSSWTTFYFELMPICCFQKVNTPGKKTCPPPTWSVHNSRFNSSMNLLVLFYILNSKEYEYLNHLHKVFFFLSFYAFEFAVVVCTLGPMFTNLNPGVGTYWGNWRSTCWNGHC